MGTNGRFATEEITINMGPQHPSTHGVLHVIIKLDGERVLSAEPDIGFLHRGIEKMAENRTYSQFMPLTDRLDYVGSMSNNWAYARTVEKMADIAVPERAEYLRVIVAELQRIASHLVAMGTGGLDTGAWTPFLYMIREREHIMDLFESLCGARLTYNYVRIGGVSRDIPDGWIGRCRDFLEDLKGRVDEYERLLFDNFIFQERTKGVGILDPDVAIAGGASGPVIRGSGLQWDLRKSDPYSLYELFDFDIPVGQNHDSFDRLWVRLEGIRQSARIIDQALSGMPAGPVFAQAIPRHIEPPPGEAYDHIESPRGELGFFIVSDGSPRPYRLKIRSPAFCNLSLLPSITHDVLISDLVVILGSLDPVFGGVDR